MEYGETGKQRCFHEVFDALTYETILAEFAFGKAAIEHILLEFDWKKTVTSCNGFNAPGITVLCILLRRFVAPCRWKHVEALFGMKAPVLSELFWVGLEHFYEMSLHLILGNIPNRIME